MESETKLRLFVVEPRGSGGMIHHAYQMCVAFAEEGADVTLVTARNYELDHLPHPFHLQKQMNLWTLKDSSLDIPPRNKLEALWRKIFWNTRRVWRGLRLITEWTRLTHYLVHAKPDIIQFGSIEFPFEALFLRYLRHKGLVLSQICHEFEPRESSGSALVEFGNRMKRQVYTTFTHLFFHAENNRSRFKELFDLPISRLHIIDIGNEQLFPQPENPKETAASFRERYKIAPDAPLALFFGILAPSKGLETLLEAFALVHQKNKSARLLIAGSASKYIDLGKLHAIAQKNTLGEAVIFDTRYIPIEEVGVLMEMTSVAIYPYWSSTQSASLQVAYHFERPVIATKVGGLPEVVDEGKSGFLVPPRSPDELATAILKFIDNPQLTAKMGAYAKELSETRFAWRPIARKVLDVYKS